MFEALRNDAKRKGLNPGDGLITVGAIAHDARQVWHLSDPSTVGFTFEFDRKNHGGTVASGSLPNKRWSRRPSFLCTKRRRGGARLIRRR